MPLKYQTRIQANYNTNHSKVEDNMKNIKVEDDVHSALGELGKLSESYNLVIRRLISHYLACPEAEKEMKTKK
jgi:hypothetical protein